MANEHDALVELMQDFITSHTTKPGHYLAKVTQFCLPNGKERETFTNLPIGTQAAYLDMINHGFRFEAEILRTDMVSVTITGDEMDIDISVTTNGPNVQKGMIDMLNRALWRQQGENE